MASGHSNPKRWLILLAVMLAFLPVVLDMTILHVAVPPLTQALKASNNEVLWVIDIYPLLMAGLLVPMGTLADRVGNRHIMLIGLVVFGVASALGPLLGGVLLEHFWWGSVFLINVPLMLVVIPICWVLLPRKEKTTPGHWAIGEALMLVMGMISVVYAIKAGFAGKQPIAVVLMMLVFGVAMLSLFAYKQLRGTMPMLDLSLFTYPAITAGMLIAVLSSGALAGVELTLAQELQYVLDKTPLEAGVFMLPIMVAAVVGGPIASWFLAHFGLRAVASLSMLISALALAWLAVEDFDSSGLIVPALLAALGLALSIGFTASSIAIMGSVDASKGGAAGSLEATGYELGTGLGITLFGVFMSFLFGRNLTAPDELSEELIEQAAISMGDTYLVAQQLSDVQAAALINAGKMAFSTTHSVLLMTAAVLIGALSVLVFFLLSGGRKDSQGVSS